MQTRTTASEDPFAKLNVSTVGTLTRCSNTDLGQGQSCDAMQNLAMTEDVLVKANILEGITILKAHIQCRSTTFRQIVTHVMHVVHANRLM